MAAKAGHATSGTIKASETTAKATKKAAQETKKTTQFIARHKKGFIIIGLFAVLLAFLLNTLSSCSILVQSGVSALGTTTYTLEDSDMRAAEAQYCALEEELQDYLDKESSRGRKRSKSRPQSQELSNRTKRRSPRRTVFLLNECGRMASAA